MLARAAQVQGGKRPAWDNPRSAFKSLSASKPVISLRSSGRTRCAPATLWSRFGCAYQKRPSRAEPSGEG